MDFFPTPPSPPPPPSSPPHFHDTITSLMNMADKMEALLPDDFNPTLLTSPSNPAQSVSPSLLTPPPNPCHSPTDCFSTVTTLTPSPSPPLKQESLLLPFSPSPCTIRTYPPLHQSQPFKPRPPRKPKTYSKPVASRFCHICSRMPRRGQGSLTCRRMAEGYCRKIVCEQCLREQGWDYDAIKLAPADWLCPHCAECCPGRSQCHIYNRINARRKRAGNAPGKREKTVEEAVRSSDVLMGPYGHLFARGDNPASAAILQPPRHFRLNLPSGYSHL